VAEWAGLNVFSLYGLYKTPGHFGMKTGDKIRKKSCNFIAYMERGVIGQFNDVNIMVIALSLRLQGRVKVQK
jgi:hypothetical protein